MDIYNLYPSLNVIRMINKNTIRWAPKLARDMQQKNNEILYEKLNWMTS
jgi:hypothetical protein